jgi:hypothetical protein
MQNNKPLLQSSRRNFLKAAGVALGGVTLSACGVNQVTPPANNVVPNGFRFYPVTNGGMPDNDNAPKRLCLDAMLDDRNQIVYSYMKPDGKVQLDSLRYRLDNNRVVVDSERAVAQVGEQLQQQEISRLGARDLNFSGALVAVLDYKSNVLTNALDDNDQMLSDQPHDFQALCLERGRGLEVLAKVHDRSAEGHAFDGIFSDVDIHDDGKIVFAADYAHLLPDGTFDNRQGIFQIVPGEKATLLVSNNAQLGQQAGVSKLSRFGLIDLHDSGNLVVQAHTYKPGLDPQNQSEINEGQPVLLRGTLGRLSSQAPLGGLSLTVSSDLALQASNRQIQSGQMRFGPRAGARGQVGYVLEQGSTDKLMVNQKVVAQTGGVSPSGATIGNMLPPVMGSGGLVYFTLANQDGFELCAYDGQKVYGFLKSGDTLHGDTRPIDRIWLGNMTQQVDRAGRLAFVVTHPDNTATVVLGVPV